MKLYGCKLAPNSDRVEMFLAEKGIEVPFRNLNLMKGEHHSDEYRAISPNRKVPALVLDDGQIIRESVAICQYFEELHPEPPLMGTDIVSRAQVRMWQRLMELELMFPIAMTFRHTHPAGKALEKHQVPEFGEIQRTVAQKRLAVLNKELGSKDWIAGDAFSIADITAYIAIGFGKISGFAVTEDLPNLLRWWEAVKSRPSAAKIRPKAAA